MPESPSDSAALLAQAEQAHRGGRFAQVRQILKELARQPLSTVDQQRAEALRTRLRPDPMVAILIGICLVLFVAIVSTTWR